MHYKILLSIVPVSSCPTILMADEIDLLNVSFDGQSAPDRISAMAGVMELRRIAPLRRYGLRFPILKGFLCNEFLRNEFLQLSCLVLSVHMIF